MPSKLPQLNGKPVLQIQFCYPDDETKKFVTFTNSKVLEKQLKAYEDNLPFLAMIVKNGNYYTFQ